MKIKPALIAGLVTALLFVTNQEPAFARRSNNIVGVNLACRWSPDPELTAQIKSLVMPGGWMVIMATPGDADRLQDLLNQLDQVNSQINVVIRLDKLKQSFTPADAAAWVATLGSLETDRTLFVMPWNEPNQEKKWPRPTDSEIEYEESKDLDGNHPRVVANRLNEYIDAFKKALADSGLGQNGSGRIYLLSPMLNQTHPNYEEFLGYLGGATSFYSKFDGIAMNLYDFWTGPSSGPNFHQNRKLNSGRYRELLESLGPFADKPVFAVESGLVWPWSSLGVVYQDGPMRQTIESGAQLNQYQRWVNDQNFEMFAVFSYDPEHQEPWDIFTAPETSGYFQQLGLSLGGRKITSNPIDQAKFNRWLAAQTNIVSCPDGIGYASNSGLCNSVCGSAVFKPGIVKVGPEHLTSSPGDPIRLHQKPNPNLSQNAIARGGRFKGFTGLSIPFAQEMAKRLAGPFLMQGTDVLNDALRELKETGKTDQLGVLAKLTPADFQDQLRLDYYQKCASGEYSETECFSPEGLITGVIPDPPPQLTDEEYQVPDGLGLYQQDLAAWNLKYRKIWNLIPLVPNRIAEVDNAINLSCDPCATSFDSTVRTQTPWIFGLWRTADILNNLLVPEIRDVRLDQDLPQSQFATLNNQCPVPEISPQEVVFGGPADPVLIKAVGSNEAEAEIYGPKKDCEVNPDYIGNPNSCGQSCSDPADCNHPQLTCQFGTCVPKEEYPTACNPSTCSEGFDDPVWATVQYPYLEEIYQDLSGEKGIFRLWIAAALEAGSLTPEEAESVTKNWGSFAESRLDYCFEPYQSPDSTRPNVLLASQGEHQLRTLAGVPYPAICTETTPDLKVYPRYLGGVAKALEWVTNHPLVPVNSAINR